MRKASRKWVGSGPLGPGLGIGEIGADDDQLLRGGLQEAQLGMGFILQKLGLVVEGRPAVVGSEVDHIAFAQPVGGDDFGVKRLMRGPP